MNRLCRHHLIVVLAASTRSHVDPEGVELLANALADQCRDGCLKRPRDGRPVR